MDRPRNFHPWPPEEAWRTCAAARATEIGAARRGEVRNWGIDGGIPSGYD